MPILAVGPALIFSRLASLEVRPEADSVSVRAPILQVRLDGEMPWAPQQTSSHSRPISLLPDMRIVLTTFGTLGDVHPLIAIALEMRRRGHVPVLAVPEIFRPKIESLGLEFFKVGPTLNPEDPQQVANLMDIRKGTERTLREVLFPAIRQSYDELLAAVQAGGAAHLMLAGELTYQAPLVA